MKINFNDMIPVDFDEHPVKDLRKGNVSLLDVTAEGQTFSEDLLSPDNFSKAHYCYCLLSKVIDLPLDKLGQFLFYQLHQIMDVPNWLKQFEAFVEVNAAIFTAGISEDFYKELKQLIKKHRYLPLSNSQGYVAATIKNYFEQHYNLDKVRAYLKGLDNFEAQLEYLINLKIDFIRQRPCFSIHGVEPFDKLLDLEIKKIEKLQKQRKYIPAIAPNIPTASIKCTTTLTVAQLAYQYRALYDMGLYPVRTKTTLFKAVVQNYSTSNQKDISWKSFKNNFDNPDPKAIDFWMSKFENLASKAKKDKEK